MSNRSFRLTAPGLGFALAMTVTAVASTHDHAARQDATSNVASLTAQDALTATSTADFDPNTVHRF